MKKVLTLLFSVVMALVVNAQTEVTKFLGIPVDGTKAEMVQKIKAKGFETSSYNRDILEGEFNGEDVEVSVVCNNRKVFRVCVFDAHSCSEADIKFVLIICVLNFWRIQGILARINPFQKMRVFLMKCL